ncbi:DEAD/DEAH box helicase family protein [uncultured Clostridium sp.]|uniref:DEAD/DEAH box helicase n=1 Tax=uncultured Clostridium sp. TaxID=59620 RepID=UPI0027DDA186|nr:DEAD/DEAH box helicase family protein [uncultured Clostridium sp.]
MEMRKINYQIDALFGNEDEAEEGLISITNRVLKAKTVSNREVILKAITGAGKTIIMSNYIKEVYSQENRPDIVFVWLSIGSGGLQFQSAEKIATLLSEDKISVICPKTEKDFNEEEFKDKTVLVFNWEKINNTKDDKLVSNLMIGERHNLKRAIENTLDNVKFIVLIDEFHRNYRTPSYNLIMELFKPVMILGMTATPTDEQIRNKFAIVNIPTSKVREEGMIKIGTVFNEGCEAIKLNEESKIGLEEAILEIAINKRMELEAKLRDENSDVIPLCLIQVPNNNSEMLEKIKTFLETQKDNDEDIIENESYACWLSDTPKNPDIIKTMNTNNIKYLIFKQAVATGWDCPRAHILVKYRPIKSKMDSFDLQTIGRILRTPERIHYKKHEELNYAYIYAPEPKIDFDKEVEEALGNPETKNQKITYLDDVSILESVLKSDIIQKEQISAKSAEEIFRECIENKYTESKANSEYEEIHIFEGTLHINDNLLDTDKEVVDIETKADVKLTYNSVQLDRKFSDLLKTLEKPFLQRSDIKAILFDFFNSKLDDDLNEENKMIETIRLCLMHKSALLKAILETSNIIHQRVIKKKSGTQAFEFPKNPKYMVKDKINIYTKSLYKPCVNSGFSEPEHIFIQELEKNRNVKWWYKNRDSGKNALSVVYVESETKVNGKLQQTIALTYPDFIVCFENEGSLSVGIYEIKDADKLEEGINDRKHAAIQKTILEYMRNNTAPISAFYGGVVKIKNFNARDEEDRFIGEIQNIDFYKELSL